MKKRTRRILIGILILPAIFILYSVIVIIDARIKVPGILLGVRCSGLLKIQVSQLTAEQKE